MKRTRNSPPEPAPELVEVGPVQSANFDDGDIGRAWRTLYGLPYRGNIHIAPKHFKDALFAQLIVQNYGDDHCHVIVTDTTETGNNPAALEELLSDDVYVINAITKVVNSFPGPRTIK